MPFGWIMVFLLSGDAGGSLTRTPLYSALRPPDIMTPGGGSFDGLKGIEQRLVLLRDLRLLGLVVRPGGRKTQSRPRPIARAARPSCSVQNSYAMNASGVRLLHRLEN
jgi:hypothetical protein